MINEWTSKLQLSIKKECYLAIKRNDPSSLEKTGRKTLSLWY